MRLPFTILGIFLMGVLVGCKPKSDAPAAASGGPVPGSIDPALLGLWAPDFNGPVVTGEFDFYPDGNIVQRINETSDLILTALWIPVPAAKWPSLQWILNGVIRPSQSSLFGWGNFANGKFTMSFAAGNSDGTYTLSEDHRKLTLSLSDGKVFKLKLKGDAQGNPLPPLPPPAPTTSNLVVDPKFTGIWRETVPVQGQNYSQVTLFETHPSGQFIQHIQQVGPGQSTEIGNSDSDTETDTATIAAANGRFNETLSDGTQHPGSYVFSPGHEKMIVEYDADTYGYLFEHLADVTADDSISFTTSDAPDNTPAHLMDPELVRTWMSSYHVHPQDNFNVVTLLEWHADGNFEMHIRNVSPGQAPLDAKDTTTITGLCDAFHGRYLLAEPNGDRETGVYTVTGNQLVMAWDSEKNSQLTYSFYGTFDTKGNVVPYTTPAQ